jgi:hypothetical protein
MSSPTPVFGNHLKYGFLDSQGGLADYIPGGEFLVEVGACTREPLSPLEEAARAAGLIRTSTDQEIFLCMSGGIDSECMALGFLEAGIRFSVAIMRFSSDLNGYDIRDAVDFCERNSIPCRFFDLDIPDFYLDGRHFRLGFENRCTSPQLTTHLDLLAKVPGFPVLSWNICRPHLLPNGKTTLAMPTDLYFSYHRFLQRTGKEGVGFFFLYTPELFYSFLKLPLVKDLLFQRGAMSGRSMGYAEKCDAYRQGGFQVKNREEKYTGFEQVKLFFQNYLQEDARAFDRHFRLPLQMRFPQESRTYVKISSEYV